MATLKAYGRAAAIALPLVAGAEGLRTYAYRDPVGIPTLCFGETRGVHMGDRATADQCKALLAERLAGFEAEVRACLGRTDLPAVSVAAFTSFAYNVGAAKFCTSTMARKAKAGDLAGACDELPKWNRAGGIPLPGLTRRRAQEQALCRDGLT